LEGRDALMPSSSIPSPVSLPIFIRALTCFPTLVQENYSLRRGKIESRRALDMALRSVQMKEIQDDPSKQLPSSLANCMESTLERRLESKTQACTAVCPAREYKYSIVRVLSVALLN
jgi:hypothetical protein